MATANNNKLIIDIGSLTPVLVVDRQKLMQVFLNLLSNACKFTKNGTITFKIFSTEHFIHFSVSDTGVGIDLLMLCCIDYSIILAQYFHVLPPLTF